MIKSYKRECFTCFGTFRKPVLGKVVTFASLSRYLWVPQSLPFLPQSRYLSLPPLRRYCRSDLDVDAPALGKKMQR